MPDGRLPTYNFLSIFAVYAIDIDYMLYNIFAAFAMVPPPILAAAAIIPFVSS